MKNFGLFIWVILTLEASAWGGSGDKILLKDVQTLTLRVGQFTNGRRSPGVPQIKCIGGTAGCDAFVPQVVQCYNRGWDGADFQWECKADMDNAYRFGSIAVTCEGYDYPDDPYVLRGSCGLEYVLDLTKEGYQTKTQERYSSGQTYDNAYKQKGGFSLETLTLFAGVGILVYAVYKTCIAPTDRTDQRSTTNDDYPGRPDPSTGRSNPPPPGFRSDYYPSGSGGDSCSGGATRGGAASSGASSGAGGFWTGAATGGLLGYMFGNRNSGYNAYNTGYAGNRGAGAGGWSFDNWGSRTGGSSGYGSSMASTSSGTRSASGFGGTRRR